jgi:hypothetical protein
MNTIKYIILALCLFGARSEPQTVASDNKFILAAKGVTLCDPMSPRKEFYV